MKRPNEAVLVITIVLIGIIRHYWERITTLTSDFTLASHEAVPYAIGVVVAVTLLLGVLYLVERDEGSKDISKGVLRKPDFIRYAFDGATEELRRSIQAKRDVNIANRGGFTALHAACYAGQVSCAQLLADSGANPNTESKTGVPPILALLYGYEHGMIAQKATAEEILRLLLQCGADPNWTFPKGVGYLHLTIKKKWHDLTAVLLSAGAKPDAKADGGSIQYWWRLLKATKWLRGCY